jgi:putative addiction module antidote
MLGPRSARDKPPALCYNVCYNKKGDAMKLKITPIGNSFGVILPKELLAKLNVAGGDAVYITETPDGFSVSPYDPDFEKDMERAKGIIKKRRNMLRELAKR